MEAASVRGHRTVAPQLPLRLLGDGALARLAARGHKAAFEVIFERHRDGVYRYCRSILRDPDDAADALQNTMTRALRALPGEQREIALKPWLYRIARNESLRLAGKRAKSAPLDDDFELSDPASEDGGVSREQVRSLLADMGTLSERQRSALVMRELIGLTYAEVSAALELTPAAAKQAVYEARTTLTDLEAGRTMDCEAVRHSLSDNDRRKLRGLKLRAHLRDCPDCRAFAQGLKRRPAVLAAAMPAMPATLAAGMLGGGGAGVAGGASVGLGAGVGAQVAGVSGVVKIAATAAVIATAGGAVAGEVASRDAGDRDDAARSPSVDRAPINTVAATGIGAPASTGARALAQTAPPEGRGVAQAVSPGIGSPVSDRRSHGRRGAERGQGKGALGVGETRGNGRPTGNARGNSNSSTPGGSNGNLDRSEGSAGGNGRKAPAQPRSNRNSGGSAKPKTGSPAPIRKQTGRSQKGEVPAAPAP